MKNRMTHILSTALALLCLALASPTAWAQQVSTLVSGRSYYIQCGGSQNGATQSPYLCDNNGTLTTAATQDDNTLWTVTAVDGQDGYYTVKNQSTGRYLAPITSKDEVATVQSNEAQVYLCTNTNTGTSATWFNIKANASSNISYNKAPSNIVGWTANNGNTSYLSNSEWAFLPTLADYLAESGFTVPTASTTQLYRVVNHKNTSYALAEATSGLTTLNYTLQDNASDYSQYWYLIAQSDGTIAFKNLLTDRYVQSLEGTKNAQFQMGTTAHGFTLATNAHNAYSYDIRDTETLGFNCTDQGTGTENMGGSTSTGAVYSWTFYTGSTDLNSLWDFQAVTLTADELTALETAKASAAKELFLANILKNAKVRIRTARGSTTPSGEKTTVYTDDPYYITDTGSSEKMQTLLSGDDANKQIWIIQAGDGNGYVFRNLSTGKYLDFGSANATAKTFYLRYYPSNTSTEYYVNLSTKSDFSGDGSGSSGGALHAQGDGYAIVQWTPSGVPGSNWLLESVDITDDEVRAAFDKLSGTLSAGPTEATYVKLTNYYNSQAISYNASGSLTSDAQRSSDASQLWQLVPVADNDGYYQLKSAVSASYISNANSSPVSAQAAEPTNGFLLKRLTSSRFESIFNLILPSATGKSLHSSNGNVIVWDASAGASKWRIQEADLTDEEIAAAATKFSEAVTELGKKDTYNTAFTAFFTDATCSQLSSTYQSMSDDELTAALQAAGIDSETLQAVALKVKNNSWATWEQTFRVRTVQPYSNAGKWNNLLKIGNEYTSLSNPTGIWANAGEVHYVFVGDDVPQGASLTLRSVSKSDSQGSQVATLSKGLNSFTVAQDGALYFVYTVDTDTTSTSKKIADYPTLPLHLEGGTVDGYFDATRSGIDTDEAWQQMVSDGLFQKSFVMMKGRHLIYQLNGTLTKQYIPTKMREIVDFWDWMMDVFHEKMAINDYYDRWNNVNGFYSCTYNYMFATTYGTFYNESTLGEVLSYDKMAAGGGSLWGPAHENGHNHQSMINMIGCTEISNNLFSQIIVHLNGKTSTRLNGRKFADVANLYAAGTSWHDYNLWDRNTLYLKLYLYYEVAGHKPDFCRALFRALRQDPLNHSTGSQANPTPASEDFLKFALKCCEVTGDDLSEFFEAYGFFVPFETRQIGDYANYWTENTQAMIDEAKAKMHTYAKPKGNLLFIENHIKHEPAIDHEGNYLYNADGSQQLRTDYNSEDAVGKCGDVGSYSDFTTGHYASGYTYSQTDNTITMSGQGAVGYKVYDNEGNLLYFSNQNTFTLPDAVVTKLSGKTMVIKAAQPDGTDVTLPAAGATTYELKVYHADALTADKSNTVYTDGTATTLPTLEGNALAFIQPTATTDALPETLTEATNIIDATDAANPVAQSVVIADKESFYTPTAFTAAQLTYERSNTAGWNSVCLPFAITPADFGSEAKVETLTSLSTDTQGTATLHFEPTTQGVQAGEPCLVYCPETTTEWNITKANCEVAATPVSQSLESVAMQGSFQNAAIGAGHYKLNSAGTAFGITSAAGKVTAFRSYISLPTTQQAAPRLFLVEHGEGSLTGIQAATAPAAQGAAIYDLQGRRIAAPAKGQLYIVNGRKAIAK